MRKGEIWEETTLSTKKFSRTVVTIKPFFLLIIALSENHQSLWQMKQQLWSTIQVCNYLQQKWIQHFKHSCAVKSGSALIKKYNCSLGPYLITLRNLQIMWAYFDKTLAQSNIYKKKKLIQGNWWWRSHRFENNNMLHMMLTEKNE